MATMNLSAPWIIFYKEIQTMFREDPDVHVVYAENGEHSDIRLYVESGAKADALTQLLIGKKVFGNVEVGVTVVPSNGIIKNDEVPLPSCELYRRAFQGNPALAYTRTVTGIFVNDLHYIVFQNRVVQYFNDDLGDANGVCSTLYQEIAKDIFEHKEGVYFCTEVPDGGLDAPLGEWP